ncbi:MAG TPA: PQQ-binding-like beta-propeller repeat protein [Nonomuraea sp.]|nr:PQQ-binding-like beta-propeller repeat protein [Nonomuraea sp.]
MRHQPGRLRRTALSTAAAIAILLLGQPGLATPAATGASWDGGSSWSQPNADKAGTRRVGGPIDSRTVSRLGVAWRVPITARTDLWPGGHAATPVVVDGVVYTQDLDSNVYAVELRTGRLLWTKTYGSRSVGPNGVAVAYGKVFGATGSHAFALDAATGAELWSRKLVQNEFEGIDMQPGVDHGTVYVSTVPGNAGHFLGGEGQGVLWALDANTGTPKWTFDTVPKDLWGRPELNSGGGVWYPPSFDGNGDVYIEVANPAPFIGTAEHPWGSSRPGPNLYSNSMVKLDRHTGAILWYNQVLPHDIYDWDFQNSPVLTKAGRRPVVIGSGKMGIVYQFDRATGKLLWKTPVGRHNGHDDDNLLALRGEHDKLPAFPFTTYPGVLGGVISPIAVDDTTVYAAANNVGATWRTQEPPPLVSETETGGDLVALDLVTGRVRWTHPLARSPYGGASVVNDLVFTTTFDGTVHAVSTRTGKLVWQTALPSPTNSPVAINGPYLIAVGGWPQGPGQRAEIVAYRLGASEGRS